MFNQKTIDSIKQINNDRRVFTENMNAQRKAYKDTQLAIMSNPSLSIEEKIQLHNEHFLQNDHLKSSYNFSSKIEYKTGHHQINGHTVNSYESFNTDTKVTHNGTDVTGELLSLSDH